MKAISYFTSSDARHGKYGRRPNVEMPENTESAFALSVSDRSGSQLAYLSSTITGQSVVPQGFVRPLDWNLVLMIAMSKCSGNQDGHGQDVGQHGEGGGGGRGQLSSREGKERPQMRGIAFMNSAVLALLESTTGVILTVRYYR
jgi:hypothetical protein